MATGWNKVRQKFLLSKEELAINGVDGQAQSSRLWGRAYQGALPKRIENLNGVVPGKPPRPKSKAGVDGGPQSSVQLDYSDTYRENDALEGDLEEHLDGLKKDHKRHLLEKGEQLREIRKQVEVITRLQELVNSRKPGSSANLVARRPSSRSSVQYGGPSGGGKGIPLVKRRKSRPSVGNNTNKDGGVDTDDGKKNADVDVDFGTLAQATRTQMRIAAEREKYSAKNLFNQRRPKTALGNYSGGEASSQRRFFAGPSASVNSGADIDNGYDKLTDNNGFRDEEDDVDFHSNAIIAVQIRNTGRNAVVNGSSSLNNGHSQNNYEYEDKIANGGGLNDNSTYTTHQQSSQSNQTASTNRHLRPATASSRRGVRPPSTNTYAQNTIPNNNNNNDNNNKTRKPRPKTAVGFVTQFGQDDDENGDENVLPPRSKSRIQRSRSRRELELLCRVLRPEEEEAAVAVAGDSADQWEMINAQRRRRKLLNLRRESSQLDVRVKDFLDDIQGFNKRRGSLNSSPQRRPSSAGFLLRLEELK